MAKKARTPPPPRRVQAPQRRHQPRSGVSDRAKLYILAGIAGGGVLALIVVLIFLFTQRDEVNEAKAKAALEAIGCTYKRYPNEGRNHTSNPEAKIKYKTFPPTSGTHFQTPAPWGTYPVAVDAIVAVHNLEHGGIIVNYGSKVPPATVDLLEAWVAEDPRGMLMFPLEKLGNKIALVAWTRLGKCTKFDEDAYTTFRDAFRGKGPERFSLDDLQPGQ